ncbi:MAG: type IV toxin-antitoxin system AbiEi family antitoxin [Alphaproteobacteria bacterium]
MDFAIRSLSPQESRVVLSLAEHGHREVGRQEIIRILGVSPQAADHVIRSLRRKGWLERASWGRYLLIPPDMGPEAIGEGNLLALASRIADPYYFGYGTAATYYGLTTQHRNVIWLVSPVRLRDRRLLDAEVRIVNLVQRKFFGYGPVDALGYQVMMSDREKTAIDCIDRPDLAGGVGEVATILARASCRIDWHKLATYLTRIDSTALVRRFGWLADHVGAEIPADVRDQLHQLAAGTSKAILGPNNPTAHAIGCQSTWQLAVHVDEQELQESAGLARRQTIERET